MKDIDCLIIAGGEYAPPPPEWAGAGCIIACDRGYEYASRMGLDPDIIIGDFDSAPYPEGAEAPIIRLPVQKDDTDTMYAVRYAMDRGYRNIAICAALGGRFDHSVSNIQTASYVASHGGECCISGSDHTLIHVFPGPAARSFKRREGSAFSVFSLTEECRGVSISGSAYDGDDIDLTYNFPLGVSNKWQEDEIEISINSGIIMVIINRL